MWAQIRLPQLQAPNNTRLVPLSNVIHFDQKRMKNKLFNVSLDNNKTAQICQVISIAKSQKELEDSLKGRRITYPPLKNLDPATDISDFESGPEISTPKTGNVGGNSCDQLRNDLQDRLKNLERKKTPRVNLSISNAKTSDNEDERYDAKIVGSTLCKDCENCTSQTAELTASCEAYQHENLDLKEKNKVLEDSLKKLMEELDVSKTKISDFQTTLQERDRIVQELEKLNFAWQNSALANWDTMQGALDDLKKSYRGPTGTGNKPTGSFEIGYVTDDGSQIHLGRDVWLSVQTYSFVTANVKSVSGLTRNLLSALFDERTLLKSTISGKTSNRATKSTTQSLKEEVQKLDPVKVMAIKDFVRYYLVEEWKLSEDMADTEADLVRHYISKKISDLKEATNPTKKQKKDKKKKILHR